MLHGIGVRGPRSMFLASQQPKKVLKIVGYSLLKSRCRTATVTKQVFRSFSSYMWEYDQLAHYDCESVGSERKNKLLEKKNKTYTKVLSTLKLSPFFLKNAVSWIYLSDLVIKYFIYASKLMIQILLSP